jgi:hypothetical protein
MLRKAHKYYDLRQIVNILIDNLEDGRLLFNLVFSKTDDVENYETRSKQLYFSHEDGQVFFKMLKYYFQKLRIPIAVNE